MEVKIPVLSSSYGQWIQVLIPYEIMDTSGGKVIMAANVGQVRFDASGESETGC